MTAVVTIALVLRGTMTLWPFASITLGAFVTDIRTLEHYQCRHLFTLADECGPDGTVARLMCGVQYSGQ